MAFAGLHCRLLLVALVASVFVAPCPLRALEKDSTAAIAPRSPGDLDQARDLVLVNPSLALSLADRILQDSQVLRSDVKREVEARWIKSQALFRLGRHEEALSSIDLAILRSKDIGAHNLINANLLYTRGIIKRVIGDLKGATGDIQESLVLFRDAGDKRGQSKCLQIFAAIYQNSGNYSKAKEYYDQSIETFNSDPFMNMALYNNRAILNTLMKNYSLAKDDFKKSLEISRSGDFPKYVQASILTNLSSAEIRSGDLISARRNLSTLNEMNLSILTPRDRSFIDAVNAQFFYASGDYLKSAKLFDDVFSGIDTTKTTPEFKFFHELASIVYSKLSRDSIALEHHIAFKRLDDEARDLMVNTNSALMAAQFDFANQDLRIARLKAEQLRKDAELASSRNRIVLIALGGLAITVGLLGFNFLSLRRSSRRITTANTQLSRANQALETALKARSDFLATTSHEIRTPLNGILGVTQVLLSDPGLSADVRDRISLMNGAGETMRAMVDDLLDMAKIESGTLTLEKGETDLNGLLDDAVRLWTDKAQEKGLDLLIDRSGAPGRILEDGPRLRQIVFNLLSNAIKFTEAGSVHISAGVEPAEAGERLVLRVADTGIGIPTDQQDAVFESFKQVEGGVTRRFEGTGLGLSISRRLAEAMGGTLGVESQIGEGSTFTLILPLVRASTAAAANAAASGGVFLIIEANPLTQSVLKSIIAPLGLLIETASSPEAAAEVLATGHVSALLVDAAALGLDRTARATAIAGLVAAGARGLAVTWPSPEPEDIEAALAAGAVKVIAKPISAARLTEALLTLLPESA